MCGLVHVIWKQSMNIFRTASCSLAVEVRARGSHRSLRALIPGGKVWRWLACRQVGRFGGPRPPHPIYVGHLSEGPTRTTLDKSRVHNSFFGVNNLSSDPQTDFDSKNQLLDLQNKFWVSNNCFLVPRFNFWSQAFVLLVQISFLESNNWFLDPRWFLGPHFESLRDGCVRTK